MAVGEANELNEPASEDTLFRPTDPNPNRERFETLCVMPEEMVLDRSEVILRVEGDGLYCRLEGMEGKTSEVRRGLAIREGEAGGSLDVMEN